ncbi:MAG: hypothetical protein Pg6B_08930 [Candidatus Azobacteroides pseudotrichonymphae]|nr:MAG: hypothetical protein Pg6B_08930 [Candidatus Azobacteroides pseudotrichonymphae]
MHKTIGIFHIPLTLRTIPIVLITHIIQVDEYEKINAYLDGSYALLGNTVC